MRKIEWIRALTHKRKMRLMRKRIRRNYRVIYRRIKQCARKGLNVVGIRFPVYDANIKRLRAEGYTVNYKKYHTYSEVEIIW